MSMARRELREYTMKLVYQYGFYKDPEFQHQSELFLKNQEELTEADREKVEERVRDLFSHIEEIDSRIEGASSEWKISRMAKVDLSIIRLAIYEMLFDDQVPSGVAINEAVELAKIYGGDNSYQFVNGVLSGIVKKGNE